MKFAEKLTYLRKEKGLSQYDVASELNVSRQAISRWESGRSTPSTTNLKCLSVLLDVSTDFLLDETLGQPDHGETVDNEDYIKNRRWSVKKIVTSILVLVVIAATVMVTIHFVNKNKIISVKEMEREWEDNSSSTDIDIEW